MKNALGLANLFTDDDDALAPPSRPSMTLPRKQGSEAGTMLPPGLAESSFILKSEPPAYLPDDDDAESFFDGWEVSAAAPPIIESVVPPSRTPTVRPSSFPTAPPPALSIFGRLRR